MAGETFRYPDAIVSGAWLAANLNYPALRLFDTTFYLHYGECAASDPYRFESGRADYQKAHIPGAAFLDLQADFSVADSPYRFTLLTAEETGRAFARVGVGNETRVVLYARGSMQRATRFWWMLRWIGFDTAAVLGGGLDKWLADGRPVETGEASSAPGALSVTERAGLWASKDDVQAAQNGGGGNPLPRHAHGGASFRHDAFEQMSRRPEQQSDHQPSDR
ncbi:MAG: rhodanese-like domain-containing protein [Rhodospirillaceae bacterium]